MSAGFERNEQNQIETVPGSFHPGHWIMGNPRRTHRGRWQQRACYPNACAFFPRIAKAYKNGAGGNRTPVPEQSAGCLYVRSWCFKSQRCAGHQQPAFLPSVQKPPRTIVWMHPDRTSLIIWIPRPIRRQVGDRLRNYAASAYCGSAVISVACFLRGQHAPRHATSSLPCPVETSRPQLVNVNSTHPRPTKFDSHT
jgi:hypothetical protein